MSMQKNKPSDYDVSGWEDFYRANPGMHRSVGADGEGEGEGAGDKEGEGEGAGTSDTNWRTPFAGGDDKRATQLERFTTAADFGEAYFKAQSRLTDGDMLKPLPDDASDDDLKAFREQQGIPLEAKGYLDDLPEGLVIGEDDMPFMVDMVEKTYDLNMSKPQMHGLIKWYNDFTEKADADQHDGDEKMRMETEDYFRGEWGSEYRKNTKLINARIEGQFGMDAEAFLNARTPEGAPLLADPGVLKGLINMSREINPSGELVQNNANIQSSMEDELAGLKKDMRDDRAAWNKSPEKHERFQILVTAINKQKERSISPSLSLRGRCHERVSRGIRRRRQRMGFTGRMESP